MIEKAFYSGILVTAVFVLTVSTSCPRSITCPCGSGNQYYTHCLDNTLETKHTCETWAHCRTCRANVTHCVTCPPNRIGPTCTKELFTVTKVHIRRKRQSVSCSHPGVDMHGIIEGDKASGGFRARDVFSPGEQLKYRCEAGYELKGSYSLICTVEGKWSASSPTCKESRSGSPKWPTLPSERDKLREPTSLSSHSGDQRPCSSPTVDPNGSIGFRSQNNGQFDIGIIVGFVCKKGYVMEGRGKITCQPNGQWDGHSPTCRPRDTECGRPKVPTSTLGTSITAGEYPWVVFIASDTGETCGGALVDRRTVLSAAHCFPNSDRATLYFGKYYRSTTRDDENVVTRRSTQIINHPNFNPDTFDNDIAIVRFSPDVSYSNRIQPICMPTTDSTPENVVSGNTGNIAGWGLNENRLASTTLMLARLPVQRNDVCEAVYENRGQKREIQPGMFCAGLRHRKINVCEGDSGSPLVFFRNKTKRYYLEGLVSHGLKGNCDVPEKYSMFTKVAHYMHWIRQHWKI